MDLRKGINDIVNKSINNAWNQRLKKGQKIRVKDKNGQDTEAFIDGFYYDGKVQDEDTYQDDVDNNWHDFRGIKLVDDKGNHRGDINAYQILELLN